MISGITRKFDSLGRVTIPMEIRDKLGLFDENAKVDILVENNCIILTPVDSSCNKSLNKHEIEQRLIGKYSSLEVSEIIKQLGLK